MVDWISALHKLLVTRQIGERFDGRRTGKTRSRIATRRASQQIRRINHTA